MPAGTTPAFCRRLNALALSITEFTVAARDYPIVFATLDGGKSFAPVIVASACVDEGGIELFDAQGKPTQRWQDAERLRATSCW